MFYVNFISFSLILQYHQLPRPIQWLAPEAIKLSHVIQSDIWSLGLLMWEIFNAGDKYLLFCLKTQFISVFGLFD